MAGRLRGKRSTGFNVMWGGVVEGCSPARNPRVVSARLARGEVLLLHLESGAYHELNALGGVIWDLLEGDRSPSEIAAEVRDRVDDPPEDLEEIVSRFLERLRERDLLGD